MPDTLSLRNPPAPTCEDYDDDNDTVFHPSDAADRRQEPQLATKGSYERQRTGGSDSGYSSKAGTNDSENSVRKKLADLTINTDLTERKRQPYSMSYSQPRPRAYGQASASTKDKGSSAKDKGSKVEAKTYYVHKKGECWVCDNYGKHIDLPEEVTKTRAPSLPKTARQPPPSAARDDNGVRPTARRQSTTGSARPTSMYAPSTGQIRYSMQPLTASIPYSAVTMPVGYNVSTPITTTLPYIATSYPYTPVTPMSAYSQDASNSYFDDGRYRDAGYSTTSRRGSMYGPPVLHSPVEEVVSKPLQRTSSQREAKSSSASHRSTRDHDYERSERDRAAMPPPRKPQSIEVVSAPHRPGIRKSATYNTASPTATSNRRSVAYEDELDYDELRQLAPVREYEAERAVEKSRPPSSYPTERARPRASKSASYSTPTHITHVSSSSHSSDRDPPQRVSRASTLPTSAPLAYENRLTEAEAHQRVRSTLTSSELTTEALRKYTQREPTSRSRSETESSHKSHSSSSAGRSKTTRSNSGITMSVGGVNLSMNPSDGQNINISTSSTGGVSISLAKANRGSRDLSEVSQKRIERAPSVASRSSRVSTASKRDWDREMVVHREANSRPTVSRAHSRAPSRRDSDFGRDERETWSEQ